MLYEEPLDDGTVTAAVRAIASADLLVIAGTSLAVYPAAGLIDYFSGDHLAIINRTPTPRDAHADLCIATNVGEGTRDTSDIPRYIRTDMPLYLQKRKDTLFETFSQQPLVLRAH